MTEPAAPRRIELTISDPGEGREWLDRTYGAGLKVGAGWDRGRPVTVSQLTVAGITTGEVSVRGDLTLRVYGRGLTVINTVLDGLLERDRGRSADRYQRGDVYLASYPQAGAVVGSHDFHAHSVALPTALLSDVARTDPGRPCVPVRFSACSPTADGARQWRETTRFVTNLLAGPQAAEPLLIRSVTRLLAATALVVFPNDATSEPAAEEPGDGGPETLRRAISFIEASPASDITLADIAVVARVSTRAIQLAFRRHLDTTPMEYLRRVRLDLAHRQLEAADPACETITAVAYRWGFASPSRFARYYRDAYGVLPGHTLRAR